MTLNENPSSLATVDINVLQSLSALIHEFADPVPSRQNPVGPRLFCFLPSIYGQNQTLDATIKSFVAHHFGRSLQNRQMIMYARSAYGEALHSLRKSLTSPSESLSSNLFCAVFLLCIYEVIAHCRHPTCSSTLTIFLSCLQIPRIQTLG